MVRLSTLAAAAAVTLALAAPAAFAADKPGYKAYEFTTYYGQGGYEFSLPENDVPVRIDISARIDGKPAGESMVFSALVTRDPYSGLVSWVGTDNDGRVHAGNSAAGDAVLARLRAPEDGTYAVLIHAGGRKLKVEEHSAAKGAKGYFSVRLWY